MVEGENSISKSDDRGLARQRLREPVEYIPSATEQRVLDVLLSPYHRMSSVSRMCEVAGVSRFTYYEIMKRQDFLDYYRMALFAVIRNHAGQLVNIGIREARKGSYQHWRALMDMANLTPHNVGGSAAAIAAASAEVEITVRFVDPASDEPENDDF